MQSSDTTTKPLVGLFVTCLVDFFRPSIGFAAVKLIEAAGCRVDVPLTQTCCGQPAYNNGDRDGARQLATQMIETFASHHYVVAPSGSCAGMVREHFPGLFFGDPVMTERAEALARKTYELTSFLVDVRGLAAVEARFDGAVAYHDSCAGLRELKVKAQPRRLLASVAGLVMKEMGEAETCCGFGGTFCVQFPDISGRIADKKLELAEASGADTLLAGDLGCLLHLAGRAAREGRKLRLRHVAEVLADMSRDVTPIAAAGPESP